MCLPRLQQQQCTAQSKAMVATVRMMITYSMPRLSSSPLPAKALLNGAVVELKEASAREAFAAATMSTVRVVNGFVCKAVAVRADVAVAAAVAVCVEVAVVKAVAVRVHVGVDQAVAVKVDVAVAEAVAVCVEVAVVKAVAVAVEVGVDDVHGSQVPEVILLVTSAVVTRCSPCLHVACGLHLVCR